MSGAEEASECCFLCGLPFNDNGLTVYNDETFQDLKWLECGIGFDPHRSVRHVVQSDDGYGRFQMDGTQKWFCDEDRSSPRCEYSGRVCHLDCVQFVETTIGRRIDVETLMRLYHQSIGVQSRVYRSQFYRWDDAFTAEGPEFFYSPMSDEGTLVRFRILKCLDAAGLLDAFGQSATAAVRPSPPPPSVDSTTAHAYEDLLAACDRATRTLRELDHHQRRSRDAGELSAVAFAVGANLVRLSRACTDANRASLPTAPRGANIGSPTTRESTTRRCSRMKKDTCTKTPGCKWTTGTGCRNERA